MGRASIRTKTTARAPAAPAAADTAAEATPAPIPRPRDLKKANRQARHASFVSRIEKSSAPAAAPSARSRRRAAASAATKLVTSLDALAAALPADATSSINVVSQSSKSKAVTVGIGAGKKTVKSRPGAMKRKEKLVRSECERFGKNLAIIQSSAAAQKEAVAGDGQVVRAGAGGNTWAMLRGFIGATMEVKEEFLEKQKDADTVMQVDS
ncbi:ribosome biogenesis protein SLX9-domain-containing protein [Geopyxis carbonaria]|nr:ribosome biogenesis protein SLX9-domain-containing protein [Geopyxis carbonaria]